MQVQTDKIPKHHGEFYFEPSFSRWKEDVLKNREALSKAVFWGLSPLKVRAALKLPTDQPIILSGHQPVFVHPGVWAKCLAASALAESVRGIAYHKLTDTAIAPEFTHCMPELEADGRAHRRELDFFSSVDMKKQEKSVPYAFMPAPEKAAFEKIFTSAENYAPPSVKKAVKFFSEKLLKGLKVNVTWDLFQSYALGLLDEICGTKRLILEGSALWRSDPFIDFLVYWFKHMNEMNENYNQSLNEYRRINNITHDIEPVANLKFENWYFEVPFWGTTAHHHRDTVWAKVDGKHLLLKVGGSEGKYSFDLADLKLELSKSTLMIWPKAIPQTLFCRMYLCDYFIHGTGGAVYEEVGNMFFEKAFKVPPPAFGVVSSTYLADAQDSQNLDVVMDHEKNLEWWVRALEKNPEYIFSRREDWQKELPSFIHPFFKDCLHNQELQKMADDKVSQVELLQDPVQRTIAALKIKGLNAALNEGCIKVLAALDQGLLDLKKVRETRDVLAFREYPFFCFEPEVFLDMKEKIKKAAQG